MIEITVCWTHVRQIDEGIPMLAGIAGEWKPEWKSSKATFLYPWERDETSLLEALFVATNTYGAYESGLWSAIEPLLPTDRDHTSLSVGDSVILDGRTFVCAPLGWKEAE